MRVNSYKPAALAMLGLLALPIAGSLSAQTNTDPNIVVTGEPLPDMSAMVPGPELKGVITARKGDRVRITTADGANTVVAVNDTTVIKASIGLFGSKAEKPTLNSLLNGLPVTVKTMQAGQVLLASWGRSGGSTTRSPASPAAARWASTRSPARSARPWS